MHKAPWAQQTPYCTLFDEEMLRIQSFYCWSIQAPTLSMDNNNSHRLLSYRFVPIPRIQLNFTVLQGEVEMERAEEALPVGSLDEGAI